MKEWSYAVKPGSHVKDEWLVKNFEGRIYHLCVHGPNGFYRDFTGDLNDPLLDVVCSYHQTGKDVDGNVDLLLVNTGQQKYTVEIIDNSYKTGKRIKSIDAGSTISIVLDLHKSFGWYDFSLKALGNNVFEKRYAGHVETGKESTTDPLMGGLV